MPSCVCNRHFKSDDGLKSHREATDESLCAVCKVVFCGTRRFEKHRHWSCPQCDFVCTTESDLARHQKTKSHWYCEPCGLSFESKAALNQHSKSPPHVVEFRCMDCDKSFVHAEALEQHMVYSVKCHAKAKARKMDADRKRAPFHCEKCDRDFKDKNALKMHLNSAKHRPLSDLPCIAGLCKESAGASCDDRFTSPSAMLQHLESGTCASGIDREQLNHIIIANDSESIITSRTSIADSSRSSLTLLWGPRSPGKSTTPSTEAGGVILTPGSELSVLEYFSVLPVVPSLRCPLCPGKRRQFPSKAALDQHMQSLAHAALPKIFHCPVSLLRETGPKTSGKPTQKKPNNQKHFATASGLAQHIESGACEGGKAGLKTAMEYIERKLRKSGLSVKLLV